MPEPIQVVIDTNVFVGALKSKKGASNALFDQIGTTTQWVPNISAALFLEYEEQGKRIAPEVNVVFEEIDRLLDQIAAESNKWMISGHRQPVLRDPDDDMLLELARQVKAEYIITYNTRNFLEARRYGIKIIRPGDFLSLLRTI